MKGAVLMGSVQRSVFGLVAVGAVWAMAGCGLVADGVATESTTGGATESTTGGTDARAMSPSRGGAGGASSPDAGPGAGAGPSAGRAAGYWVLRAPATATTPEISVEFRLSAPMGPPMTVCVG
jgi:hypothetical protein